MESVFFGFFAEVFYFFLSFTLIFAMVFGILSKTKVVSDNSNINAAIGFAVGLIFAFSGAFRFLVAVIPYFAIMTVMFATIFIVMFILGYRLENLLKSKFVVYTILIMSVFFILFSGWNLYYKDIQAQMQLYSLENTTINDTEVLSNMTGNPFHDIPLRYEYHCMRQGRYLSPLLFFGKGGMFCIMMHPRIISTIILFFLLAVITYVIVRHGPELFYSKKKE